MSVFWVVSFVCSFVSFVSFVRLFVCSFNLLNSNQCFVYLIVRSLIKAYLMLASGGWLAGG